MNKIVTDIIDVIQDDTKHYHQDYKRMYEQVSSSKAIYKGQPVPFLYIPRIFEEKDLLKFNEITNKIFDVVNKSIDLYMTEAEVREFYDFDPRLEDLIMMDHGYQAKVPMGRFDIFYNTNGEYKFCELNTDGTSAMNEDFVLSGILSDSLPMKALEDKYQVNSFELYDTWVKEVANIYEEFGGQKEKPLIAIVDFIDKASSIEFEEFKLRFKQGGFDCEIVDPRHIKCVDGSMMFKEKTIDIVYRRLVTKDLMDRYDEIPEFIEGIKANNTCLIGPIKSQIVHTKKFFELLHAEFMEKHFSDDQLDFIRRHIPYTRKLARDNNYNSYIEKKDQFIIKPTDYYASKGVFSGKDHNKEAWINILDEAVSTDYVIQEYCNPAPSVNVLFEENGSLEVRDFNNITGLYMYNEKFYGLYSRAGKNPIISGLHDCYTLPSFLAIEL